MKNWIEDRFTKSNHKTSKKDNKLPIIKLGTHKKRTVILWIIFMAGFIFAVYKNFTAINIHTVHEKAIIKEEVVDTSDIQSFAKELSYYVKENVLKPIDKDYIFSELINPVFYHEENRNISVSLAVKYLDKNTKIIQVFQYELVLLKENNWIIIK